MSSFLIFENSVMNLVKTLFVALNLCAVAVASAHAGEELLEISARENSSFKVILTEDKAVRPRAIALLLPGGQGDFRFEASQSGIRMIKGERLPNRLRPLLLERGIASYLVDSPSDMPLMPDSFRSSPQHMPDLRALLDAASKRFPNVPVFVVGHSNGTMSAAPFAGAVTSRIAGTALIAPRLIAHPALGPALTQFDWSKLDHALLLIHHRKDACFATLYRASAELAQRDNRFELLSLDKEGMAPNPDCNFTGAHNIVGQEQEVADGLAAWMKKTLGK
jgi:pimeloyl-ACP methyl ester carboxylesterase